MDQVLWQTVLGEIELSVSRAAFAACFKKTELTYNPPDGHLVVGVPNIFTKQQLESRFSDLVKKVLEKNDVLVTSISYEIQSGTKSGRKELPVRPEEIHLLWLVRQMI